MFFLLFLASLAFGLYKAVQRDAHNNFRLQPQHGATWYGLAVPFLFMLLSFTSVPTGTRAAVTRFGNVNRTLEPRAHLLLPFAEFAHEINVQTQTVKPSEYASSHDLQVVATEATLAFHYDPNYAGYIYSQLAGDARDSVIVPSILEAIKSTTALYDAQALISERPKVRDGIEDFAKVRLAPCHIVAETISITDFNFSDEFNRSIEANFTAQQHAEKAQNDLTRIQIEAQQQVVQAKGEAEALCAQREQITTELLHLRTIEMMKEKWGRSSAGELLRRDSAPSYDRGVQKARLPEVGLPSSPERRAKSYHCTRRECVKPCRTFHWVRTSAERNQQAREPWRI